LSELVYLYGFVPAPFQGGTDALAGIDGRPIELVEVDGLRAVVSHVDEQEYDSAQVESRLNDLSWVAEQGVAHERVVAWFVDRTQILPASLFTLYTSTAALRKSAQMQGAAIRTELQRLEGLREWDLKISCDSALFGLHIAQYSDALRALDSEIAGAAPGKRYLLERKRGDLARKEVSRVAREQAQTVLEQVRPHSREALSLPIPQSAEQLPVILHAALLVHRDQELAVLHQIAALRGEADRVGLGINFSGPWAPYRFVQRERSV
jgi:hypothetical protein